MTLFIERLSHCKQLSCALRARKFRSTSPIQLKDSGKKIWGKKIAENNWMRSVSHSLAIRFEGMPKFIRVDEINGNFLTLNFPTLPLVAAKPRYGLGAFASI